MEALKVIYLCLLKNKLQNLFKNNLKGFKMENNFEKLIMDFLIGVVIIGLLTILFKILGFILNKLFTLFRF